jgi:hypothetical protein
MIDNSYYSQDVHGPYELYDIGNFDLEEGGTIRGCKLAYATFGTLNAAKDNAILIPTWYSGTNKIMEQVYIGKGRALDPDKYFIIVVNQIGSGLSTSPHNTPAPAGMGNFPHVAARRTSSATRMSRTRNRPTHGVLAPAVDGFRHGSYPSLSILHTPPRTEAARKGGDGYPATLPRPATRCCSGRAVPCDRRRPSSPLGCCRGPGTA